MKPPTCAACGRAYTMRSADVLRFARQRRGAIRVAEVASHFQVPNHRAATVLAKLVQRGQLARISYGMYTADLETGRSALQAQMDRLAVCSTTVGTGQGR